MSGYVWDFMSALCAGQCLLVYSQRYICLAAAANVRVHMADDIDAEKRNALKEMSCSISGFYGGIFTVADFCADDCTDYHAHIVCMPVTEI